LTCMI